MKSADDSRATDQRTSNSVIDNALAVLRCFSTEEPLLGVTEIAHRVGIHKSTASRLLSTLESSDLVERDPMSRQFRLGMGLISVAAPLLANMDVRRVAYPVLQDLTSQSGETTALVLWNGYESVCVEQVPSSHQIKHTSPLGARYNTAYSSSVQIFLAEQSTERVKSLLRSGAVSMAEPTDQRLDDYCEQLTQVRTAGVAMNYGKASVDEVGISAGIRDHRGDLIAAIMVAAPRFRVSEYQASIIADAAVSAANEVSQRLGYSSSSQNSVAVHASDH